MFAAAPGARPACSFESRPPRVRPIQRERSPFLANWLWCDGPSGGRLPPAHCVPPSPVRWRPYASLVAASSDKPCGPRRPRRRCRVGRDAAARPPCWQPSEGSARGLASGFARCCNRRAARRRRAAALMMAFAHGQARRRRARRPANCGNRTRPGRSAISSPAANPAGSGSTLSRGSRFQNRRRTAISARLRR